MTTPVMITVRSGPYPTHWAVIWIHTPGARWVTEVAGAIFDLFDHDARTLVTPADSTFHIAGLICLFEDRSAVAIVRDAMTDQMLTTQGGHIQRRQHFVHEASDDVLAATMDTGNERVAVGRSSAAIHRTPWNWDAVFVFEIKDTWAAHQVYPSGSSSSGYTQSITKE
jgi:hypothetical protein